MSLIREALKKASGGKEPEILMPEKDGKRKNKSSSKPIQYGILICAGLGLAGVLVYVLLPGGTPSKPPSAPSVSIPQIIKKTPDPGEGEKKGTPPPLSPPKEATRTPPLPASDSPEAKERELAKKSEKFFKGPPFGALSPRPTVKISPRPSLPPKLAVKTKPPQDVPEPSAAQTSTEGAEGQSMVRLFNEAVKNQQKGLYAQAIQGYQEILAERPNHWETYNNLGLIYQNQKQYTKSLEFYQKALVLNPRYLKGHNNLGLLYLTLGKLEEAAQQFSKVLELDGGFVPAYINLAVAYKRLGRIEAAKKSLQRALGYDTESLEALYNLGLLWEQEGVEDKAVEYYRKFIAKAQGPYSHLADDLKKKWPALN